MGRYFRPWKENLVGKVYASLQTLGPEFGSQNPAQKISVVASIPNFNERKVMTGRLMIKLASYMLRRDPVARQNRTDPEESYPTHSGQVIGCELYHKNVLKQQASNLKLLLSQHQLIPSCSNHIFNFSSHSKQKQFCFV